MSTIEKDITKFLVKLKEKDKKMVFDLVKRLAEYESGTDNWKVKADDEPLTDEDIKDIKQAREEFLKGDSVSLEDLKRELKL